MLITDNRTNKNMLTAQFNKLTKNQKGFTLIELLVVIGILAILLAIVLIAINPARQFGQANDTRRKSDVTQVLNAIGAYEADNAGGLPTGLTKGMASAVDVATICSTIVPTYVPSLPVDPTVNSGNAFATCPAAGVTSGYQVQVDANGHVTVTAPSAEQGTISVTR